MLSYIPVVLILVLVGCVYGVATDAVATEEGQPSVWNGVFTTEQAKRGEQEYQQACAECHLDDLSGAGIPSLIGEPFHIRWSELSVADLVLVSRTTMPEGAPASLSRQAYVDIVSFMLQRNGFPAGESELPLDTESLQSIMIEARTSTKTRLHK